MGNSKSADKKFEVWTPEQLAEFKKKREEEEKTKTSKQNPDPVPKHASYRLSCATLNENKLWSSILNGKKIFKKLPTEMAKELIKSAKEKNLECKKICYYCEKPILKLEEKEYICSQEGCGIKVVNVSPKNLELGMIWNDYRRLLPHEYKSNYEEALFQKQPKDQTKKCQRCGKDVVIICGGGGGGTTYYWSKNYLCIDQECALLFCTSGEC